jgi:alkanesulfonate monooxygenase SsuD/methylene tetrahydromethanopterin reductase-like flavin-dependent oxidoreductase (luciferase family)
VKRFREQTKILDLILSKEEVDYTGEYYCLKGCKLTPRPIQQPRPPITIGALRPKMMRIAAEYADRWNTHGEYEMTFEEAVKTLEKRMHLFDEICDEVGRKPDDILKSVLTFGKWDEDTTFSSCNAFEEITNTFREIGVDELICYYPFWNEDGKKVFEEVSTNVLPDIR